MSAAYYDANYLFKLQCRERGSLEVRTHAATVDVLTCALHGRAASAENEPPVYCMRAIGAA